MKLHSSKDRSFMTLLFIILAIAALFVVLSNQIQITEAIQSFLLQANIIKSA